MLNTTSTSLSFAAAFVTLALAAPAKAAEADHAAVKPEPREGGWIERHEAINARAKQGDIELVFLGDSITQGWNDNEIWQARFAPRKAANMGISGDRTQHVLWRLDHGNIDGLAPKLVVLMIGTNNSNRDDHTAEEIADGIKAIVAKLRAKLPQTRVLLLAIFPRGEYPNSQREKNAEASRLAAEVADGQYVHYLDIGERFLDDDGRLAAEIMPDYLHLSVEGYRIWADAIEAKVAELLGER